MDKIKLAVIGCGGMSHWHADQINAIDEIVVDSLTDIVRSHAERLLAGKYAGRKPAPTIFVDHRRMLEKTNPDAVLIVTPHAVHFEQCVNSLRAGKHVLCEKPMVVSTRDAVALHHEVEKSGKLFQIAFQAPYTAEFQYARKTLASGELGPLQLATGVLSQGWMNFCKGTWRQDPKISGGGQLYDSCAHVLNGMMWLVDSPVAEAFCMLDRKSTPVDINAVVNIRFANGCLGSITCGGNCEAFSSELFFQGEKGRLNISLYGGKLVHVLNNRDVPYPAVPWVSQAPERNFVNVLLGKDTPRCPVRYGVLLAELMDAVYASAASGVPVKVRSAFARGGELEAYADSGKAPLAQPPALATSAPAEKPQAAAPKPAQAKKKPPRRR